MMRSICANNWRNRRTALERGAAQYQPLEGRSRMASGGLTCDGRVEHVKDVNVATIKSSTRDFVRPDSVVSHTQYGFAGRETKSSLRS
jgi:hypothetical protein